MISRAFIALGFHPVFYAVYAGWAVCVGIGFLLVSQFGMDFKDASWTALGIVIVDFILGVTLALNKKSGSTPIGPINIASSDPSQPGAPAPSVNSGPANSQDEVKARFQGMVENIQLIEEDKGKVLAVVPTRRGQVLAIWPDEILTMAIVSFGQDEDGFVTQRRDLQVESSESRNQIEELSTLLGDPIKQKRRSGDEVQEIKTVFWSTKKVIRAAIETLTHNSKGPDEKSITPALNLVKFMFENYQARPNYNQQATLELSFVNGSLAPGIRIKN